MFLSEWREFPSTPCLAGKRTWWQLTSRCCWNRTRPDMLPSLCSGILWKLIYGCLKDTVW